MSSVLSASSDHVHRARPDSDRFPEVRLEPSLSEADLGRVMGLDVGTKTIGVALSDELRMLAHPERTIARRGVKKDIEELASIVASKAVDEVVVGLPYELDGSEGRSARLARQIGEALSARDL